MIGTIEQAIIDAIAAASADGRLGYGLAAVASYAGELDGEIAQVLRQRSPAMWVSFAGEKRRPRDVAAGTWEARFTVVCYARHGRNAAERRLGSTDTVGAYQMVKDVKALLDDQDLGLAIEPIAVEAVKALYNGGREGASAAIYVVDLVTAYRAPAPADPDSLAEFTRFVAAWDVPPHGNVAPPLPAAGDAGSDFNPRDPVPQEDP